MQIYYFATATFVFAGWAVSGAIEIQSHINPEISCVGEFRYISTWTKTGIGTKTIGTISDERKTLLIRHWR